MARVIKYKWYAYKGRTNQIKFEPTFKVDGVVYDIGADDTIVLVIKGGGITPLRKTTTGLSPTIELTPADTDGIVASETKYKYDVYVETDTNPVKEIQIVEKSDFILIDTNENGE